MQRALSLYLPTWAVDLVRRRLLRRGGAGREAAILLATSHANQQWVAHRCGRAAAAGVRPGMTLAHARALLPADGVDIYPADPQRDNAALRALALWAARFSPTVAPDPPDGLLLDITGCERLFRGERRLRHQLLDAVGRLGFTARAAAAPTFGCAWAAARFAADGQSIIGQSELRDALRTLPIAALRIDQNIQDGLAEVGVERIGELFDIPRAALPSRFGSDLLLRLDQATGAALETIVPVRAEPPVRVERTFAGPVKQLDGIMTATRGLLDELAAQLHRRQAAAQGVQVVLVRFDADAVQLHITLGAPSSAAVHLWALLRPKLERVNLGHGIETITVTAAPLRRVVHQQAQHSMIDPLPRDADIDRQFAQVVDMLANRLGPSRVTRVTPVQTYLPEHVYRYAAATDMVKPDGQTGAAPSPLAGASSQIVGATGGLSASAHNVSCCTDVIAADRPSLLLASPEPVQVSVLCRSPW